MGLENHLDAVKNEAFMESFDDAMRELVRTINKYKVTEDVFIQAFANTFKVDNVMAKQLYDAVRE